MDIGQGPFKVETHGFESREELRRMVEQLPSAQTYTLHRGDAVDRDEFNGQPGYETDDVDTEAIGNRLGVVNTEQDRVSAVVSNQYDLVEHGDAFEPLVDALAQMDIDVHGVMVLFDDSDGVQIEARMTGERFHVDGDPHDSPIFNGFRARNSYDANSSVSAEPFAYRGICSNGLVLGDAVEAVQPLRRKHLGDVDVLEEYRDWMETLVKASSDIRELFEGASRDVLGKPKLVLENVGVTEQRVDPIARRLEVEPDGATRFDIYNAVTNFVADELRGDVTVRTEDKYHRIGRRILQRPQEVLLDQGDS